MSNWADLDSDQRDILWESEFRRYEKTPGRVGDPGVFFAKFKPAVSYSPRR